MKTDLERLEELTLRMNEEDLHEVIFADEHDSFVEEPCSKALCCELEDLFRDLPKFVDESLNGNTPFEANYDKVSPVGNLHVCLQGNSIWDHETKKCVLGIEVSMASPKTHTEND